MSTHNIGFYEEINKIRFDVYETLCPKQMLVYKVGQIKNWCGMTYKSLKLTAVIVLEISLLQIFKVHICKGR